MSNYFIVDDETGHNYGSKFNSLSKSNEDRDISDSKFVTNIRLGRITFNRPIADWDSLLCRNDSTNIKNGRSCSKSRFCCTKQRCKSYSLYCLMSILPCINTLLHYNWRSDLLKDISGGLTIGVMNIPQGMAYSLLAGLPPVYGLYVSFLSPLFYAIFGRCAQLSMGTFAVISLLIAGPIEQFSSKVELHYRNSIINTNFTNADLTMDDKLKLSVEPRLLVAITLTFLVGIMQLIIGFCQLGTLTSYLAPAMVSGYTSGSGYHVLSSQISSLFGVKAAKKYQGPGSFFLVYVNLFKNIRDTNLITLLISCVSIVFLITTKYFIEPLLRRYVHFNFPIPSELVVIALGTVTSAALNLHSTNNVSIVGHIASGMPQLTVPYWPVVPELIGDAILITLVSTFLSISLVKLFSMKYGDKINFNHEILSFGIMNTITAFFSCSVQSGSLSRSMVLEGTRSRTPLSGVVSSAMIIFVLLFLGPYFEATPSCILSSIIVVALKNILVHPKKLPYLWRTYKPDCVLFLVTFLSTVVLDVTYGLMVGLVACVFALSEKQRSVKLLELQNVPGTELYVRKHFELLTNTQINKTQYDYLSSSIKSVRVLGSLNFSSFENFTSSIYKVIDHMAVECERFNQSIKLSSGESDSLTINITKNSPLDNGIPQNECFKHRQISVICEDADSKHTEDKPLTAVQQKTSSKINDSYFLTNCDMVNRPNEVSEIERNNCSFYSSKAAPSLYTGVNENKTNCVDKKPMRFLLLDISGITHIDPCGATALTELQRSLFRSKLYMILCGDPAPFKCLSVSDWQTCPGIKSVYPTLYDASAVCVKALCQNESDLLESGEIQESNESHT